MLISLDYRFLKDMYLFVNNAFCEEVKKKMLKLYSFGLGSI